MRQTPDSFFTGRQWDGIGKPKKSADLLDVARSQSGSRVLLGVSGKDSLAAWLYLRENGFEIIPYMMWTVPGGFSYERESLDYYQDFFGVKIHYLPHPNFYKFWNAGIYQSPVTIAKNQGVVLRDLDYYQIEDALAKRYNLGDDYLCAIGYRAADNPGRRRLINNMGAIYVNGKRHYYYPIWDWTIAQVMDILHKYNCKLSKAYSLFGSTFDEYNWNDLLVLNKDLPEDWQLFKVYFPLIFTKMVRFFRVK
jgi:hypothetical protein